MVDKLDCGCDCTIENAIKMNECVSLESSEVTQNEVLKQETAFVAVTPTPIPDGLISLDTEASLLGLQEFIQNHPYYRLSVASIGAFKKLGSTVKGLGSMAKNLTKPFFNVRPPRGSGGIGNNNNNGKGKGPGNNRSNDPDNVNYRGGEARISFNPSPVRMDIDTGIKPDTYVSDWNSGAATWSPLHLTCALMQIPDSGDKVSSFFDKIITFILANSIQGSVPFLADPTGTILTKSNLRTCLNLVMEALQIYYFYNSILTYTESPANRNDGMFYLRSKITQTDLNNLLSLKRILQGTPIPPNLNDICFWLNQTFSQSEDTPNSALIKVSPVGVTSDTIIPDSSRLSVLITDLSSATNRSTFTLISRACPTWMYSEIPDVCEVPVYDPNFKTMWSNLPSMTYNMSTYYYRPSVTSNDGVIQYTTCTNNLDGGVFALTGAYNSVDSKWYPSLMTPLPTTKTSDGYISNRWSYYSSSLINPYQASGGPGLAISRGETVTLNSNITGIAFSTLPHGNQLCEGVSVNTITQSAYQMLEWMLSLNTIGRIKDNRDYDLANTNKPAKPYQNKSKKSKSKNNK